MKPMSRNNDHLRSDDGHTYTHTYSNSTYRESENVKRSFPDEMSGSETQMKSKNRILVS